VELPRPSNPPHLATIWAGRQRIVLVQQATDEIAAIPLLLRHLDRKEVARENRAALAAIVERGRVSDRRCGSLQPARHRPEDIPDLVCPRRALLRWRTTMARS